MPAHLKARRDAVQQNRQHRLDELRASIRQQVCHLRQSITPLQDAGVTTDLLAFTRTLDGIDHIVATFDEERDDVTATLAPITSALDRMLASLTCLRTSIALLRLQQGHSPLGPVGLNRR